MFSTAGGSPAASAKSTMSRDSRGVAGAGFSTAVQPAASAGITFITLRKKGKW